MIPIDRSRAHIMGEIPKNPISTSMERIWENARSFMKKLGAEGQSSVHTVWAHPQTDAPYNLDYDSAAKKFTLTNCNKRARDSFAIGPNGIFINEQPLNGHLNRQGLEGIVQWLKMLNPPANDTRPSHNPSRANYPTPSSAAPVKLSAPRVGNGIQTRHLSSHEAAAMALQLFNNRLVFRTKPVELRALNPNEPGVIVSSPPGSVKITKGGDRSSIVKITQQNAFLNKARVFDEKGNWAVNPDIQKEFSKNILKAHSYLESQRNPLQSTRPNPQPRNVPSSNRAPQLSAPASTASTASPAKPAQPGQPASQRKILAPTASPAPLSMNPQTAVTFQALDDWVKQHQKTWQPGFSGGAGAKEVDKAPWLRSFEKQEPGYEIRVGDNRGLLVHSLQNPKQDLFVNRGQIQLGRSWLGPHSPQPLLNQAAHRLNIAHTVMTTAPPLGEGGKNIASRLPLNQSTSHAAAVQTQLPQQPIAQAVNPLLSQVIYTTLADGIPTVKQPLSTSVALNSPPISAQTTWIGNPQPWASQQTLSSMPLQTPPAPIINNGATPASSLSAQAAGLSTQGNSANGQASQRST